jgi:molecular chaperone DnaK
MKLSRSKFEQLAETLIKRCMKPCEKAIKDAGLKKDQIDEVILVGGSTRIPAVQAAVEKFFGKKPNKSVNPDEVVALGAAVQGGVLAGDVKDVLLLDVTPLSLGIETMGNVFDIVIEANSTIPVKKTKTYSTAVDNQPSVDIHILQGERPMATDNRSIGKFILDGIPPAPRSMPQIEVTFDIDANGILKVSAKDKGTGKEQNIRIEASTGLSQEEIDRMRQEALENADSDKKVREKADKLNSADGLIFQTEKSLSELGEKLTEEQKTSIDEALNALKEAHKTQDLDSIDDLMGNLSKKFGEISQTLYQSMTENQTDSTTDEFSDVEFEEITSK